MSLLNGDRLTGAVVTIDAERLRFRPDATGGVEIDLPLAKLECVERSTPLENVDPRGDRVYPVAGGVIHGELTRIDPQGIAVDAHLVGPLEFSLATVAAFSRHGEEPPERTADPSLHEIHDALGSRIVGRADFRPTGITVAAEGLSATIALRHVRSILFPSEEPAAGHTAKKPVVSCSLELLNGGEIVGIGPRLEKDQVVVGIGAGRDAAVPLDHVGRLAFHDATAEGAGLRRIILWSKCADGQEEVDHMATIIKKALPRSWKFDVADDDDDLDDLAANLRRSGVLVVPEMENFDADQLPAPARFGGVLEAFLARGGTVVIAAVDDSSREWWQQTGLVSLTSVERVDDEEGVFEFVRGHRLGKGADHSFPPVNGTYEYQTDDK